MTLPTFIIIGASRSGTTSLYHYLRQHPEIGMSAIKETRYFAWEVVRAAADTTPRRELERFYTVRSLDAYRAQFLAAAGRRAVGEATPLYLYLPGVPERIAGLLPEVRLIAILRDPARRAFAQYMAMRRIGWETRDFERAIEDEIATMHEPITPIVNRYYVTQGLYGRRLTRFLRLFRRDRLLVLLHEDLTTAPEGTMRSILRFVGVDDTVRLDLSRHHGPAGLARSRALERLMTNPLTATMERLLPGACVDLIQGMTKRVRAANTVRPSIPPSAEARLRAFYRDDLHLLERLLDRDLAAWLDPPAPAERASAVATPAR